MNEAPYTGDAASLPQPITLELEPLTAKEEWIKHRDIAIAQAQSVATVDNDYTQREAAGTQSLIRAMAKDLNKARLDLTRPLDDIKKQIMAQEKELLAPLQAEQARLRKLNSEYETAKREEAERQRKAEEEARRAQVEEQFAAQQAAMDVFGEGVEFDPMQINAPAVTVTRPTLPGVRRVKRWKFAVIDRNAIPREYLVLDEKLVREHIRSSTKAGCAPAIAGIAFESFTDVQ